MEVFRRSCADVVTREEKWRTILLNIDMALAKLFSALINEIVFVTEVVVIILVCDRYSCI